MKILSSIGFVSLILTALPTFASVNVQNKQPNLSVLQQSFREPKNILFSCPAGGSSHVVWVLQILEELSSRGHNVTFVTKDTHAKFANNFPMINVISTGPQNGLEIKNRYLDKFRDLPREDTVAIFLTSRHDKFVEEYRLNEEVIANNNPDVVICDHFDDTCIEILSNRDTPFLITSSYPEGAESKAAYVNNEFWTIKNPTTEDMSLKDRFIDKFVTPARILYKIQNFFRQYKKYTDILGIPTVYRLEDKHKDSLKIVNSAFGIEAPRPIGPLLEMVGPILSNYYNPLGLHLEEFLQKHRRVLYIAFGQHAIPLKKDVELILKAIIHNVEDGAIDGILWATRGMNHLFPDYITTGTNKTYDIKSFFEKSSLNHISFIEWAPQMAILHHPSTVAFMTHGGAGSLHESFYTGTRIIVFPFFGDQLGAAVTAEKEKLGLNFYHTSTVEFATNAIKRVAIDEGGVFQRNINRFQAYVQMRHRTGSIKAGDLVEEVLFMHQNGKINHRYDVRRKLSFIKANNIDLYTVTLIGFTGVIYIIAKLIGLVISPLVQKKRKAE